MCIVANSFSRVAAHGDRTEIERELAEEVPIALEFNSIGFAVLMVSPVDLDDLVAGFLISERIQQISDPVVPIAPRRTDAGIVVRANLPAKQVGLLLGRVGHRTSDSSFGLCGIENIEQAMRPLPRISGHSSAEDAAVFRAIETLGAHQHINKRSGAVHAAALADAEGGIRLVREDVGRHNAFDELIGAMRRGALAWDGGFALLSSRCSYELVERAVLSDCPMLATISAPTALAIERADEAGIPVRVLVRRDSLLATGI